MAAKTTEVTQAIADHLNTLGLGVTVDRFNTWIIDKESDSALHVVVVPVESTIEGVTRGSFSRVIRVVIVIHQKLDGLLSDTERRARQDTLLTLTEQIETAVYGLSAAGFEFVTHDPNGPRTLLDAENYPVSGIFETRIEMSYQGDG